MTLIAAVGLDTFPVIYGDLLVSGLDQSGPAANAPTESRWSIPGIDQKVVLLGDNCVVAWAGAVALARTVIGELRAMALQAPLSIAIIDRYLAQLDPTVNDELSLVGWVKEREDFHQFWYRAEIVESAMFGRISAGGGAATRFVKLAAPISGGPVSARGDAPDGLERAVASMLSATSLLLQAELSGLSNPLQHLGDGFEIATFVGDKFAKVGDIAFVWWKADVDGGQVTLSGPECILKQDYSGEFLLLRALRMRPGKLATDQPVLEEAQRVISPFGVSIDADHATSISWPGMEATFTCHVVVVRSAGSLSVVNQIEYSRSRTPRSIRFSLDDGRVPFGLNQQFCEELTQRVHAGFSGG